jgi:hypothetical protein
LTQRGGFQSAKATRHERSGQRTTPGDSAEKPGPWVKPVECRQARMTVRVLRESRGYEAMPLAAWLRVAFGWTCWTGWTWRVRRRTSSGDRMARARARATATASWIRTTRRTPSPSASRVARGGVRQRRVQGGQSVMRPMTRVGRRGEELEGKEKCRRDVPQPARQLRQRQSL